MAIQINKLRGISSELRIQLKRQGFNNSDQILEATRTPADRKAMGESLGADSRFILDISLSEVNT